MYVIVYLCTCNCLCLCRLLSLTLNMIYGIRCCKKIGYWSCLNFCRVWNQSCFKPKITYCHEEKDIYISTECSIFIFAVFLFVCFLLSVYVTGELLWSKLWYQRCKLTMYSQLCLREFTDKHDFQSKAGTPHWYWLMFILAALQRSGASFRKAKPA